jgi:hypothetical protein
MILLLQVSKVESPFAANNSFEAVITTEQTNVLLRHLQQQIGAKASCLILKYKLI